MSSDREAPIGGIGDHAGKSVATRASGDDADSKRVATDGGIDATCEVDACPNAATRPTTLDGERAHVCEEHALDYKRVERLPTAELYKDSADNTVDRGEGTATDGGVVDDGIGLSTDADDPKRMRRARSSAQALVEWSIRAGVNPVTILREELEERDDVDLVEGEDDDPGAAPPLVTDGGRTACDDCGYTFEQIEVATDGGVPVDEALAGAGIDAGRYQLTRAKSRNNGRLTVPGEVFERYGFYAGEVLTLVVDDDGLHFVRDVESWDGDDGLRADGGTRSRRAERVTDRGQSSLREHVREGDTLAGVGDQDDECVNGTVACPGPDPDADVWPCFECFLAGVDASDQDADEYLADRSPRSLLEDDQEGSA